MGCISKEIDSLSTKYDNVLLLGDFNSEPTEETKSTYCQMHSLKRLIHEPICYKNLSKPSCIDLIITNRPKSFQNSCTFETALSDSHKVALTVLKISFKTKRKASNYCRYEFHNNKFFREQFLSKHNNNSLSKQDNSLERFYKTYFTALNSIDPLSRKVIRANQTSSMIPFRFLKSRSFSDKKQRNTEVSLLRKT